MNTVERSHSPRNTDEDRSIEDVSLPIPEQQEREVIEIHLYEEVPPDEVEETVVDSAPVGQEMAAEPIIQGLGAPPKRKKIKLALTLVSIIVLIALIAGGSVAYFLLLPLPVTVTIVPQSRNLSQDDTIIVVTSGNIDGASSEIPGRRLSSITIEQSQTVVTTGTTVQPAVSAKGTITFYNAAPSAQTLGAFTLITGKDGTQVMTDATVTVPAANFPTFGSITVPAHAVVPGPDGNIGAHTLDGDCCLYKITAANTLAFVGGQAASSYQSVAQSDVDNAVSSIETGLNGSVTAAMSAQVRTGEALISPPNCSEHLSTDVPVGARANQVTVTEALTCTGVVYDELAMKRAIAHDLQPIAHYRQAGDASITVKSMQAGDGSGIYTLTVQVVTVFVYAFSSSELATLASHIAGESQRQAKEFLLQSSGVQSVSVGTNTTLPNDPGKIHFLFLLQG